jgi:hypothetical protein
MKQVLIKPLWDMGLGNRLFDNIYPHPMTLWRRSAAGLGIALDTWDTMPLERADCVWLMDLPRKRTDLTDARRHARHGVPFVLQIMESPIFHPHEFIASNRTLCDYLVSYEHTVNQANAYRYRLPIGFSRPRSCPPFAERRCAIMINTNRVEGFLAMRQGGMIGLPGIGRHLGGWKMPVWHWLQPARGELYSWRRKLARTAEQMDPAVLTLIGPGWQGERLSWCPFYPNRPYRSYTDVSVPLDKPKAEAIAEHRFCISVENYRGRHGYISEKVFDAIAGGAVPVYLGDEDIGRIVPEEAFVDVRRFRSHRELLRYLVSCTENEWKTMRDAGRAFLETEQAKAFTPEAFVERMNYILVKILGL